MIHSPVRMARHTAQLCLGVTTLIAAIYALSIPFPSSQPGEDGALLRLGLLSILSIIAAILLSFSPRTGHWLGLLLATGALAQLITSVVEILRFGVRLSSMQVAAGLTPWALAVIAGMIFLIPVAYNRTRLR